MSELNDTFFIQYGRYFSYQQIKKTNQIAFKDHPQFPILIDTLSRRDTHHAILQADFPAKMYPAFFEALLQFFAQQSSSPYLQYADLIYLDTASLSFAGISQKIIEKDFSDLHNALNTADKYFLLALTSTELLIKSNHEADNEFLHKEIQTLLKHPKCRIVVLTNIKQSLPALEHFCQFLTLEGPTETDIMLMLKEQCMTLENFHHVIIPDELLTEAYQLAKRYLSTHHALEKTLLLLDSAAARLVTKDRLDTAQVKPVLTATILMSVLSAWTQIPIAQLPLNKFKLAYFTQEMHQRVFGQDTAIHIIAHELQQAHAHLQEYTGPFCRFLFIGDEQTGKKTAAITLTELLFKQLSAFYVARLTPQTSSSILDIKFQRYIDKRYFTLQYIAQYTPYTVIMLENIEHASSLIQEELQEILTTGYLYDAQNNRYDFHQMSLILTTTLTSKTINALSAQPATIEPSPSSDLMQLIFDEQKQMRLQTTHDSPYEIANLISQEMQEKIPAALCQQLQIVPFLPLTRVAVEKIMHFQIKKLNMQLNTRYHLELGYAVEVVRYLTNQAYLKRENTVVMQIDKVIKQLYFCVEQTLLNQTENKKYSNQLFLQLNETGQALKCEWLPVTNMHGIQSL